MKEEERKQEKKTEEKSKRKEIKKKKSKIKQGGGDIGMVNLELTPCFKKKLFGH